MTTTTMEPIAIVGMACRLPGAGDVEQYWRNLVDGVDSIRHLPASELLARGVSAEDLASPDYVPAVASLADADRFDADLFGMPAREADVCNPQIRLFLELCHSALENAGRDPFRMPGSVGVFGSADPNGYLVQCVRAQPDLLSGANPQYFNDPDYLATHVSHKLGLRGPSMTVLSACSSSLLAVHLAAQSLRVGECDTAVAGGVAIRLPWGHGYLWTPGVRSRSGRCRPFDASAEGTVFGDGGGVVVLRRLADALEDGDDIRAVILGSAVNNDGGAKASFSAPGVPGQRSVVMEAMALANVLPTELGHVEAHATGTAVGDPIEVNALTAAYAGLMPEPLPSAHIALGSVKSNIGHLTAAAGVAGLIKTVLMLDRGAIVPTIGVARPNPALDLDASPFRLATGVEAWSHDPARPRRASVSSLGVGGTNVHVVLGEGPSRRVAEAEDRPRVVMWSARTVEAEKRLRADVTEFLSSPRGARELDDAVATLRTTRTSHPVRAAAVTTSGAIDPARVLHARADRATRVAFLFPGQGTQTAGMAMGLYGVVRPFTIALDECLELFETRGIPLYDKLVTGAALDGVAVQPWLFAVEYALAGMWSAWGVEPAAVLGHSLGELTAATVAGVFDLPDAVDVLVARSSAMAHKPVVGGLLAVRAPAGALPPLPDGVAITAENGPIQTVLACPGDLVEPTAEVLTAQRMAVTRLPGTLAFHHPAWQAAADLLRPALADTTPHAPKVPLYSAMTGREVTATEAADPGFWADQMVRPVLYGTAVDALLAAFDGMLIEVGPGETLTKLAAERIGRRARTVASLADGDDDETAVLTAAGRLWVNGVDIDWKLAGQSPLVRRTAVPGYPYQRTRHWIDAPRDDTDESSPFTVIDWSPAEPAAGTARTGTALVLLPPEPAAAEYVAGAVRRCGYEVIEVRTSVPDEIGDVLAHLTRQGVQLDAMVHAATAVPFPPTDHTTVADQTSTVLAGLLAFARGAVSRPAGHPLPRFALITTESVDVSGGEPVNPAKAMSHGLVRSLIAETAGLRAGVIDVGDRVTEADLAAELACGEPPAVTALRGHRRWTPNERQLTVTGGEDALRERGVYLITGGLGGLGLAVARGLADTGTRPRIALMSRHVTAEAAHKAAQLEQLGAEVLVVAGDVCDPIAVERVLSEVEARFGPVNGVFHLAGLPGGRMIAFRNHADAMAVLAPKTVGTATLTAAFRDRPEPDFAVLFSSRAAEHGLVGNADYAAANGFLDAAARTSTLARRVVSIGWPVWHGAGMVDPAGPDPTRPAGRVLQAVERPGTVAWQGRVSAATHWVLDEHRVGRTPVMPGTGYLDLVVGVFKDKLGRPDCSVTLTEVVFTAPLRDKPGGLALRVEFEPDGDGYTFTVSSAVDDAATVVSAVVHASGHIADSREEPEHVDIAAIRTRLRVAGAGPVVMRPAEHPFTLGPRWRCVKESWQSGTDTLVELELLPAFTADLAEHRLHPAMLDVAVGPTRSPAESAYVPFSCRQLVIHSGLTARFTSHIRHRLAGQDSAAGDIDLVDENGILLVRCEEFTFRKAAFAGPAAPAEQPAATARSGVGLAEGVDLLMRVLRGTTPPHVLVRPHGAQPPERPVEAQVADTAPLTGSVADQLWRLWQSVLGSDPADEDTDFFDVGGDSLAAVDLMGRIRAVFGMELGIGLLLRLRTFGALLETVKAAREDRGMGER